MRFSAFNGIGNSHPFNTSTCGHEIGRKAIGGFPGHEHIHPTGEQLCLKCGKTLKELLERKADFSWTGIGCDSPAWQWMSDNRLLGKKVKIEITEIKEVK